MEVACLAEGLVEKRESHHVGDGAECSSNLDLLWGEALLHVEALDAVHLGVHNGALLSRSDSHFLITVSSFVDLDEFPYQSS